MAETIGLGRRGDALAGDHIEAVRQQMGDELLRLPGFIGVVAVDEHVNVGFDIREHAADDVSFTLQAFVPDNCAGGLRHADRVVGRVIVVDVYSALGQRRTKVLHDLSYSAALVETGDEHRNPELAMLVTRPCATLEVFCGMESLYHLAILAYAT